MEQETYRVVTVLSKRDAGLKWIARASAWALLAVVLVEVFSGWGITQTDVIYRVTFGVIDRGLADAIHRAINVPLAFFFLSHVLINIKLLQSRRSPSKGLLTGTILVVVAAALLALTIYLEYFRLGG
jgi:hypothetical protein